MKGLYTGDGKFIVKSGHTDADFCNNKLQNHYESLPNDPRWIRR
jgi:ribosomal protein L24E